MENILKNSGLKHIAENIFLNLDFENLEICGMINWSCKQIMDNPIFWLRKFVRKGVLSKENQKEWNRAIQSKMNSDMEKHILMYLKWNLKNNDSFNLPCYTSSVAQEDLRKKINDAAWNGNTEIVKIMVPLTDNPNASDQFGWTPIYRAAYYGHAEIVKILAPLTDNPNAPSEYGQSPILWAAFMGFTEIVQILAPFTNNPNAPNRNGGTPILYAAERGNTEIVRILAPLSDNPNAPDKSGHTPINMAQQKGHHEIVNILQDFTKKSTKRGRNMRETQSAKRSKSFQ